MIEIIQIIVLIGIIATAVMIVKQKDLIVAAVIFAAFSFLLSVEFFLMQAPDVAIAEAAVGAGISTAIFVIAIRGTHQTEVSE